MECSAANGLKNPCTVLYRPEQWNVPANLPWGLPLTCLCLNRFSELLVHKPGEGFLLSLLATMLSPPRWTFSKFVESQINKKHRLAKCGMVPKHDFTQQISSCLITTVPEKFYDKVEEGSIILKKSQSFSFCEEGILVDGEPTSTTPLKTDVVILATGFREMKCQWLAELLDGTFKLPSIKEMENDMLEWDEYLKRSPGEHYRRSCIALPIWYNDQLCKDMGWNPKRKKGFFAELFEPYGPLDYVSPSRSN
ncbi:hypothetical protein EZV62_012009 [Acer yangbiense]|uniref:Flavin-containing monooxygenase n=1 Tax=Acer yangbiense TaxID=1000413 RepID=A0A5C7I787_9ROSI|nr:hypothetical protein EZV62_012009 [Acer yangbiense]